MENGELKMESFNEYRIERLDSNNVAVLASLYKAVYGRKPAKDFFQKKYDTAFAGVTHIGYIAFASDNTPVAFYGAIPCSLTDGRNVFQAAQCADAMTHLHHRKEGLFSFLSEKCVELCKAHDIKFVFGFPNQSSAPIFLNELGWSIAGYLDRFVIPVERSVLSKFFLRGQWLLNPLNKKLRMERYRTAKKGIASSMLGAGFTAVLRDEKYLEYKSFLSSQVMQLGNAFVWLKTGKIWQVGDFELGESEFDEFMKNLRKLAKEMDAGSIQFQCSRGTKLHELFSTRYRYFPSFPFIYKDLGSGLNAENIKFTFADIDIF